MTVMVVIRSRGKERNEKLLINKNKISIKKDEKVLEICCTMLYP